MANNRPLLLSLGQGLSLMLGMPAISTWKSKKRPTKAKRGTLGFNLETNKLEYYDGDNWYEAEMSKA